MLVVVVVVVVDVRFEGGFPSANSKNENILLRVVFT